MSPSSMVVFTVLQRIYRPVAVWFTALMLTGIAIADAVVVRSDGDPALSLWRLIFGSAAKYWLLVIGIVLVTMHLRQFVANGVTRRDFTVGSALLGLPLAVGLAVLVPAGNGLESALLHAGDHAWAAYPGFSVATGLAELGRSVVIDIAYLVSGLAVAVGFYRYGGRPGVLLMVPALAPIAVAEGFLGAGSTGDVLPVAAAAALAVAVTGLVAAFFQRLLRDVPIRRTAG